MRNFFPPHNSHLRYPYPKSSPSLRAARCKKSAGLFCFPLSTSGKGLTIDAKASPNKVFRIAKLKHKYIREIVTKQQADVRFFLFLIFFLYFNVLLFLKIFFLNVFYDFVIPGQHFCHPRRDRGSHCEEITKKNLRCRYLTIRIFA